MFSSSAMGSMLSAILAQSVGNLFLRRNLSLILDRFFINLNWFCFNFSIFLDPQESGKVSTGGHEVGGDQREEELDVQQPERATGEAAGRRQQGGGQDGSGGGGGEEKVHQAFNNN